MKLIAFAGMPGAGKSLAAEYAKKLGFDVFRLGDLTDEELKNRDLEVNEKNEQFVREDLRQQFGMHVYAERAAEKAEKANLDIAVLDGVRSYEEYVFLRKKYDADLVMISIMSSMKTRYERLGKRKIRPLTVEECESRDKTEIENINHAGAIVMGDHFITNEGTEEQFKADVNKLLERFIRT